MPSSQVAVVVLAAGLGQRLTEVSDGRPKWLLRVGAETIAERQLDGFRRLSDLLDRVIVVAGAAAQHVHEFAARHGLEILDNEQYAARNNWYSAQLGLEAAAERPVRQIIVVNGDLCATPTFFEDFVRDALALDGDDSPAILAADLGRPLTDEAMKVATDGSRLTAIGKVDVDDPVGEYPGLLALTPQRAVAFARTLAEFADEPGSVNNWYEHGIQRETARGQTWTVLPTRTSDWVEIDTPDDLDQATALLVG